MKAWIPDYANEETTSKGESWTANARGFIRIFSDGYNVSAPYEATIVTINGKIALKVREEAQVNANGARQASNSEILPVASGDTISVSGNSTAQIFFIPGRWV